jgi:predicted DNA-binding transcriptional regulator YafY
LLFGQILKGGLRALHVLSDYPIFESPNPKNMSIQGIIKSYMLIYEKVNTASYPSMKDLQARLMNEGFNPSGRTMQRYLDQMRNEFGVEISYSHEHQGYFLDTSVSTGIDQFIRLVNIANTAGVITETLRDGINVLQYISFEGSSHLQGVQYLEKVLRAIRESLKIKFEHRSFQSVKAKKVTLRPYLLKEYQQRWYIIGRTSHLGEFRIYGIDRISNMEVTDDMFQRDQAARPAALFDDIVGLNYSAHEPEEIILSFAPSQGPYLKTLPLHGSQEILSDDDSGVRIRLFLRVNYEFRQRLLSYGDKVTVIEPEWLKADVVAIYRKALENY